MDIKYCPNCQEKLIPINSYKGRCDNCGAEYLVKVNNFEALKLNMVLKLRSINRTAVTIFVIITFIIYLCAIFYTMAQKKIYQTSAQIEFVQLANKKIFNDLNSHIIFSDTGFENFVIKTIRSNDNIIKCIDDLKLVDKNVSNSMFNKILSDIRNRINVGRMYDSNLFSIKLVSTDPKRSTKIVNKMAEVFLITFPVKFKEEIEKSKLFYELEINKFKSKIDELKKLKDTKIELEYLNKKYSDLKIKQAELFYKEAIFSNPIIDLNLAGIPRQPIYPNARQNGLAGFVIGIIVAFFLTSFLIKPAEKNKIRTITQKIEKKDIL